MSQQTLVDITAAIKTNLDTKLDSSAEAASVQWNNVKSKPGLVTSINGSKPDSSGNVSLTIQTSHPMPNYSTTITPPVPGAESSAYTAPYDCFVIVGRGGTYWGSLDVFVNGTKFYIGAANNYKEPQSAQCSFLVRKGDRVWLNGTNNIICFAVVKLQ